MTHYTTLEIDEIATEVRVDFYGRFGEIEINSMKDMDGNEIAPDLLDECDTDNLYNELDEVYSDWASEDRIRRSGREV